MYHANLEHCVTLYLIFFCGIRIHYATCEFLTKLDKIPLETRHLGAIFPITTRGGCESRKGVQLLMLTLTVLGISVIHWSLYSCRSAENRACDVALPVECLRLFN